MHVRWLVIGCVLWTVVGAGCSCSGDDDDMAPDGGSTAGTSAGAGGAGGGMPPLPTACASDSCHLLDPDSDPACGAGQGCHFLQPIGGGDPEPLCQRAGDAQDEEPCDAPSDCAPGLGCSVEAEGGDGLCHPYCCALGTQDTCPDEQLCVLALGGGVGFCDGCDACEFAVAEDDDGVLTSPGCPSGQGCYPVSEEDECRLCLGSPRNLEEGALCDHANDCKPGLGCYSLAGGAARCRRFCALDDEDGCGADFRCEDNLGLMEETTGLCVATR